MVSQCNYLYLLLVTERLKNSLSLKRHFLSNCSEITLPLVEIKERFPHRLRYLSQLNAYKIASHIKNRWFVLRPPVSRFINCGVRHVLRVYLLYCGVMLTNGHHYLLKMSSLANRNLVFLMHYLHWNFDSDF